MSIQSYLIILLCYYKNYYYRMDYFDNNEFSVRKDALQYINNFYGVEKKIVQRDRNKEKK